MEHENEDDLFAEAVKDVKPLGPQNLADRPSRGFGSRSSRSGEAPNETDFADTDDDMSFVRSGIQKSILRKLRNGQIRIEDQLDLHRHTVPEAEAALRAFLQRAQAVDRQRAVRVIHGKGLGSPDGKPILKKHVREWLFQNEVVLACCRAGPADGGSGAVRLLLRRK